MVSAELIAASSSFGLLMSTFIKQSKTNNVIPVHSTINNTRMTRLFLSLLLTAGFAMATYAENPGNDAKINLTASTLEWTGRKVTGKHNGTVNLKEASLQIKDGFLLGGSFVIDMSTIKCTDLTGEYAGKLEGHLKSDDFFGVAAFSTATLVITQANAKGDDMYEVKANLTVKGITQPISFNTQITQEGKKYRATSNITIDRTLFNVKYGSGKFYEDLGDKTIYDEFDLKVSLVTM
jgi:polyisoprenoid-binding protein YceI